LVIEPSDEIKAVVRRFNVAMIERDHEAMRNLLSRFEGLRFIGTDPGEWWKGHPSVTALLSQQIQELPDLTSWTIDDHEGYQCGQVGWSSGQFTGFFSDGTAYQARMSAVLVLESGQWRIVQWHVSEGVSNEYDLTTTLHQLIAAIGDSDLTALDHQVPSGTMTVMFTDIEGSTELAARLGDSRWYSLLEWHDKTIAALAAMHNGTVIKSLGDGVMLTFGTALEAVRCACEIQEVVGDPTKNGLRIRIGIHSGDSIRRGDDLLGTTVNKAARVAAVASGGEIVVSNMVKELVADERSLMFGREQAVVLRGLEGSHVVHTVKRRTATT
jgi:adenylate cyclase